MAEVDSTLESWLKCPVCQDTVRQPKTLQCFHSFCEECVTQLLTISHTDVLGVKCPVCRAFTEQSMIKTNYLMNELLETHKGDESGSSSLCEMCLKDKISWKCCQCKAFLCQSCKVLHLRVGVTRGHDVIQIENKSDSAIDKLVFCEKHTDQTVIFNCRECEEPLCIKCKVTKHSTHDAETIEDALDRVLPEMEEHCEKIKQLIQNIDENRDDLVKRRNEVKTAFEACRKEGEQQLQKIIDRVTEDYNALVKELDIREEEEVDKLRLDRQKEYKQLVEWMETCKESAKGVSLMEQIQSGLGRRMRQLAELKSLDKSYDRIGFPKLVSSTGNLSSEENLIGKLEYSRCKLIKTQKPMNYRNPEISFKDILQRNYEQKWQLKLKGPCKRISIIQNSIWAPVSGAKYIQVIDVGENPQRDISCTFKPWSVTESSCGDIIVASDTGLHVLCSDGTVQSTICSDAFYDVCFFDDEIVGLNGTKRILQTFSRSGDGEWRHSGDIGASQGTGANAWDNVVATENEYLFTMFGKKKTQYYKCDGKTGPKMDFSSSQQSMNYPLVCGVDSINTVLVADNYNQKFQVHEAENKWSVITLEAISSHDVYDCLYDANTDTVWVLSYKSGGYITKLDRII